MVWINPIQILMSLNSGRLTAHATMMHAQMRKNGARLTICWACSTNLAQAEQERSTSSRPSGTKGHRVGIDNLPIDRPSGEATPRERVPRLTQRQVLPVQMCASQPGLTSLQCVPEVRVSADGSSPPGDSRTRMKSGRSHHRH